MFRYTNGISFADSIQDFQDGYYYVKLYQDRLRYYETGVDNVFLCDIAIDMDIKPSYQMKFKGKTNLNYEPLEQCIGVLWNFTIKLNSIPNDYAKIVENRLMNYEGYFAPNYNNEVTKNTKIKVVAINRKELDSNLDRLVIELQGRELKSPTFTFNT
jgi:hypothetical protein